MVFVIDVDDFWLVRCNFEFFELCIRTNDNQVPRRDQMSGRSVNADRAAPRRSPNGISRQPVTIVDVVNLDLLVLDDVRGDHQIVIDRDAPLVMQLSIRHSGSVDLGFEQNSLHAEESI